MDHLDGPPVVRLTRDPRTVAAAMVTAPWTHDLDLTVAGAREAFTDAHVHMLLLTDSGVLQGTLLRDDLATATEPTLPALDLATLAARTVPPDHPVEEALARMREQGTRRLAVVDAAGLLLGLLCLKRTLDGFCSDADVRSRALEHGGLHQIGQIRG
jgi:CBS domain-containing protein